MAKIKTLMFKETIQASVEHAYRAFTNSTALRQWLCDAALLTPSKGGRVYLGWNSGYYAAGEIVSLAPNKKVTFTWLGRGEPAPTRVQVALGQRQGSVTVTIAHSGFGAGKGWAKTIQQHQRGWEAGLKNLKSTLETGEDRRLTMRPMLGILLDSFDAKIAERLGVPVKEGVRISGTVDGMGAQAAGLVKDDVIVSMAGKKVTGGTLAPALQGRQAGDTVAVKFYRSKKLNTVKMTLSKRPLPDIPPTGAALADRVRVVYAELDAELEKCFEGVSEAEASYKSAPHEWSAKDVVCHLLAGERDGHAAIAQTIDGFQPYFDGFGDNVNERHVALMAVHPTCRQLLDEYRRAEAETLALLAAVPESTVARKQDWWQLCFNYLQPPLHNHGHFDQIRAAIAAARNK